MSTYKKIANIILLVALICAPIFLMNFKSIGNMFVFLMALLYTLFLPFLFRSLFLKIKTIFLPAPIIDENKKASKKQKVNPRNLSTSKENIHGQKGPRGKDNSGKKLETVFNRAMTKVSYQENSSVK